MKGRQAHMHQNLFQRVQGCSLNLIILHIIKAPAYSICQKAGRLDMVIRQSG
jgi:hypothetical protein